MGLNPTNFFNTNPPSAFFGCLDATGTNVVLEWSNAPGPVVNYIIERGIQCTNGSYMYSQILVSSNTTFFVDSGAISNANAWNNTYMLTAAYPGNVFSGTDTWNAYYAEYGYTGLPYSAPTPNNAYAYLDATGTNVEFSWTPPSVGEPTNYLVMRGAYDSGSGDYNYAQIASLDANTTYFEDTGVINCANDLNDVYEIEAIYPGGGLSQAVSANISTNPPPPTGFSAAVDSTGTNIVLSWVPPQGITVTNYIIERGVLNTNASGYNYTQISSLSGSATSFEDVGVISPNNSYNFNYQIEAINNLGDALAVDNAYLSSPPPPSPQYQNVYLTAFLARNGTGRWQVMFSGLPTNNADRVLLTWKQFSASTQQVISVSTLTNNVYQIPDSEVTNILGHSLEAQIMDTNGNLGQIAQAGTLNVDAPYFVDGRQHLKRNLIFLIRAACLDHPLYHFGESLYTFATNFTQISFLYNDTDYFTPTSTYPFGTGLSDLWPFTANYDLATLLLNTNTYDANYPPVNQFVFEPDFAVSIPAPPMLDQADPYWIIRAYFLDPYSEGPADWGVTVDTYTNGDFPLKLSLESGISNFFGLPFQNGCLIAGVNEITNGGQVPITNDCYVLPVGDTITVPCGPLNDRAQYASWCPAPTLQFTNYYFAPVVNPDNDEIFMPVVDEQSASPLDNAFNTTNQTPPVIVGSVGQPMIVSGWAKYYIQGSANKYAYLGQYFETNAFLLNASGNVTTTNAGILSPYGEFFPLQGGQVQLVTMPDIDTGVQGTSVVDVVSLNVDANHDGTMDFSYAGPDQTSPSRPFRFWVNDVDDTGDDSGDGIPGGNGSTPDGMFVSPDENYSIQGSRNLVNFFPVYLNIGSLFQSNALSAGISATDTNYQFVLSQADGALRFAYTDLTPANYMNFLQDTNEVFDYLHDAPLTTVSSLNSGGVPVARYFLNLIAGNNGGIILLEAWTNTTQPLVLTIYHGTNQIAQTQLYLSITGVEQMFRHKNILLDPDTMIMPDRLSDADVPNEPDTTDMNFIFLHGYNVNPTQARGYFADVFKRMYWSGSHAKFYGVTWEAFDTQVPGADITTDLQKNIVNSFLTAPYLADFLRTLTNGPNVLMAHSLGNMPILSALSDWNAHVQDFFMVDAAVAIEAIQGNAPQDTNMIVPDWYTYTSRVWATEWYNLFPTNDYRHTLTWRNRFPNLPTNSIYNFYSSGEEVLREQIGPPPGNIGNTLASELLWLKEQKPLGVYAWAMEEKDKGLATFDSILSSTHGGWQFNDFSYGTNTISDPTFWFHMSPDQAALLSTNQLQTNAFFDVTSYNFGSNDLALFGANGSGYAFTNQTRILSDTIPALTLPVGANAVPTLSPPISPIQRNFDMQTTFENGWPADRGPLNYGATAFGEWHHSDFQKVAYTFTYKLYEAIVEDGNLQ
jgi:hypothetical protein